MEYLRICVTVQGRDGSRPSRSSLRPAYALGQRAAAKTTGLRWRERVR
ncbi:hypothetical protein MU582_02595 [Nocardioidaceae bacterium SCSIO 66511]|nr:hypothetical protein MU582_02595 [Nocardioidaceae bacterium SCSIO 66511]